MNRLSGYGSPNKEGCLELISLYGFDQLGGGDGCRCAHFFICGFHVDVSCHKSEHCIRVYSNHMYRQPEDEVEIAALVVTQLGEYASGYKIRYCEYSRDHVNGRWEGKVWKEEFACCYCGKPREGQDDYLCVKCLKNKDAVSYYPFGLESFRRKCPNCHSSRVERDLLGFSEMKKEPVSIGGREVGFSMFGSLPKQENESIFRCLGCEHHWRERN